MKNILVIVDDFRLRSQIKNSLIGGVFHIISADNTGEGMRLVQEQYPDLILTDFDVLNPDDYDFLKQVRELTFLNQVPILLLTQEIDREFCLKVWQLGISLYFLKTVDLYFLSQVVFCELKNR